MNATPENDTPRVDYDIEDMMIPIHVINALPKGFTIYGIQWEKDMGGNDVECLRVGFPDMYEGRYLGRRIALFDRKHGSYIGDTF